MDEWMSIDLEKSSQALGDFNPILFRLRLHFNPENIKDNESSLKYERVFFHEFVHFLQGFGSTFNIATHFEVMDHIAQTLQEMEGYADLVLHGFSSIHHARESLFEHFRYFHRIVLDGNYDSRPVPIKTSIGVAKDLGFVSLNEDTYCYEYIRWNIHDREYFATPLGTRTLQENLAYVLEQVRLSTTAASLVLQFNAPSNSSLHYYNAAFELFWRTFAERNENPTDLCATLVAILDLSLQTVPFDLYQDHPDRFWMTTPSFRFVRFLQAAKEIRFINHLHDPDYLRFIEEISNHLGWPSPITVWHEYLNPLSEVVNGWRQVTQTEIQSDPRAFNSWVETIMRRVRHDMYAMYNHEISAEVLEERAKEFEQALRGSPLGYAGIFGLGIAEYMIRALRIRIDHPLFLVFPQKYIDRLHEIFPLPAWWLSDQPYQRVTPDSVALFYDLQGIYHLWALTLQWARGKRQGLTCGNRYFGSPCLEPLCREGRCPEWTVGAAKPVERCTFTDVLDYFRLWEG